MLREGQPITIEALQKRAQLTEQAVRIVTDFYRIIAPVSIQTEYPEGFPASFDLRKAEDRESRGRLRTRLEGIKDRITTNTLPLLELRGRQISTAISSCMGFNEAKELFEAGLISKVVLREHERGYNSVIEGLYHEAEPKTAAKKQPESQGTTSEKSPIGREFLKEFKFSDGRMTLPSGRSVAGDVAKLVDLLATHSKDEPVSRAEINEVLQGDSTYTANNRTNVTISKARRLLKDFHLTIENTNSSRKGNRGEVKSSYFIAEINPVSKSADVDKKVQPLPTLHPTRIATLNLLFQNPNVRPRTIIETLGKSQKGQGRDLYPQQAVFAIGNAMVLLIRREKAGVLTDEEKEVLQKVKDLMKEHKATRVKELTPWVRHRLGMKTMRIVVD